MSGLQTVTVDDVMIGTRERHLQVKTIRVLKSAKEGTGRTLGQMLCSTLSYARVSEDGLKGRSAASLLLLT